MLYIVQLLILFSSYKSHVVFFFFVILPGSGGSRANYRKLKIKNTLNSENAKRVKSRFYIRVQARRFISTVARIRVLL